MEHCSLQSAYELLRLDLQAQRFTRATLDFYRWRLTPFIAWCTERRLTYLHEVTATHIRRYLVELQDRGLSDYSQLAAARALRAWLNFAVREGLLESSPFTKVRMPDVDERVLPAYSDSDIHKLLTAADTERDKAIILTLLDTGMRAFELLALDGVDVDLDTGAVRVRMGKGRKERMVYLGLRARKQLLRYYLERGRPGNQQPVFLAKHEGERLGRSGLFRTLRALGKRAGVKPCTPHRFRRTFALLSLQNGMSIYHLQRLMGHKGLHVLVRYLALSEADLHTAHEKFGVVDRLDARTKKQDRPT